MVDYDGILRVIWTFESAPSAHALVREFTDNPCTDQEFNDIYNSSEGYNDSHTESIVRNLSPEKLAELKYHLLCLNNEYKQSYGADYDEFVGGLDVVDVLK